MTDLAIALLPRLAARNPLLVQPLAQQADPVAAPEQFALEHESGHTENARRLRLVAQPVVLGAAFARQERGEACRRARLGEQRFDLVDLFRIEGAPPEA